MMIEPQIPPKVVDWVGAEVEPTLDEGKDGKLPQPVIAVRLKSPPGSAGLEIHTAHVFLSMGGTTDGTPIEVPLPATRVAAAENASYGPAAEVRIPVPPEALQARLSKAPAGSLVFATVMFADEHGFTVLDPNFNELRMAVRLDHRGPAMPASPPPLVCEGPAVRPSGHGAVDLGDDLSPPNVVTYLGVSPSSGLVDDGGPLVLEATLAAPKGSAGTVVKGFTVVYGWDRPDGERHFTSPKYVPLAMPRVITAGGADTCGPNQTVVLPIDGAGFAEARQETSRVLATFELVDEGGFVVLDQNFQNIQISTAIALR